ncbi:MAG: hypothetical protein ACR2LX_09945 [Jatrophihabitans sp.]
MSTLPDPGEMLAIADRIAAHARTSHARADTLHRAINAAQWHGPAAAAFVGAALAVVDALRRSAGRLGDAADALRRHARAVQHELDLLQRLSSVLLDVGIDVDELITGGLVTPIDLIEHAGTLLDGLDGLAASAGGLLHDTGSLLGDAGDLVGSALGLG